MGVERDIYGHYHIAFGQPLDLCMKNRGIMSCFQISTELLKQPCVKSVIFVITIITINKSSLRDLGRGFHARASLKHPVDWVNGFFCWIGITNFYLEPNITGAPSMYSTKKS